MSKRTAYESTRAKQVGMFAVKDGWTVSFGLTHLPPRYVEAIHRMHREPCAITVVPFDPDDLFSHGNAGEVDRKQWTPSQKQRVAIRRWWIAKGSPGNEAEHYDQVMAQILVWLDQRAAEELEKKT